MKRTYLMLSMAVLLSGGVALSSCTHEDELPQVPPVDGGNEPSEPNKPDEPVDPSDPVDPLAGIRLDVPKGGFTTARCRVLPIAPQVTDGKAYNFSWSQGDSLLATTQQLDFISLEVGRHTLTLQVSEQGSSALLGSRTVAVDVTTETTPYSPYVASVLDYRPAPGQFINELPPYEKGDTQQTMNRKASQRIANNARSLVSLGGFGGYIVCSFDHTIVNVPGEYDFKVLGNAFFSEMDQNADPDREGGNSEPGIVMVAYDRNGNGQPDDDEWYELAGSEYGKDTTTKHYTIRYYRPDPNKEPVPAPDNEKGWNLDAEYIRWTDGAGGEGFLPKNSFHKQSYYPEWIAQNELDFEGTCLPRNGKDESLAGDGSYWVLYAYDWGYADNMPNNDSRAGLKIEWAVDRDGQPVHLPGIDFVKIYTGVNQCNGRIGETSTEVMGVNDLHLLKR